MDYDHIFTLMNPYNEPYAQGWGSQLQSERQHTTKMSQNNFLLNNIATLSTNKIVIIKVKPWSQGWLLV